MKSVIRGFRLLLLLPSEVSPRVLHSSERRERPGFGAQHARPEAHRCGTAPRARISSSRVKPPSGPASSTTAPSVLGRSRNRVSACGESSTRNAASCELRRASQASSATPGLRRNAWRPHCSNAAITTTASAPRVFRPLGIEPHHAAVRGERVNGADPVRPPSARCNPCARAG